jgi:hypothetical protein
MIMLQRLDPSLRESLTEILSNLVKDQSPYVVGPALQTFYLICPDHYELLHPLYRKLCSTLEEFDDWSRVYALLVLLNYARAHFPDPSKTSNLDPELAFLFDHARPLLVSDNTAVLFSNHLFGKRLTYASRCHIGNVDRDTNVSLLGSKRLYCVLHSPVIETLSLVCSQQL